MIPYDLPEALKTRCAALDELLSNHRRIGIAFSGGVDSTLLAWYVHVVLEREVHLFLVAGTLLPNRERGRAVEAALETGLNPEVISLDPLASPSIVENSPERCYHCKKLLMSAVRTQGIQRGCSILCDGTHAEDHLSHRPGRKALDELGFVSPLGRAGFSKEHIRELSRLAGLSTWNRPSQSCLATRVPYGTRLTTDLLQRIDLAESILLDMGIGQVRVRVHGDLARIEIPAASFHAVLREEDRSRISESFRRLGFIHTTLDILGFRSGSWDESTRADYRARRDPQCRWKVVS